MQHDINIIRDNPARTFTINKIVSLEKHLIEASLEFQYLSSAENLYKNIKKNLDLKYESLDVSQIYSSLEAFIDQQKQLSKISTNETQTK